MRCWFCFGIINVGAFDTVPDGFFAICPFNETLHAAGDVPEFAGNGRFGMNGGIYVEGSNVTTLEVFGIIFGMVGAGAATIPVVPGNTLAEV